MRKFRNAALAAATATAVAFGGTVVADAQTLEETTGNSSTFTSGSSKNEKADGDNFTEFGEIASALSSQNGRHQAGQASNASESVDLDNLWGKRVNDDENPQWARIWRDGVNWLAVLTGLGLAIAAGNFALYTGLLPQIKF